MKIQIEWTCSTEAKLTVDGRKMKVTMEPGITKLTMVDGSAVPAATFGGFIGEKLFSLIGDFMQAECIVDDYLSGDPLEGRAWEELPDDCMAELEDRVW